MVLISRAWLTARVDRVHIASRWLRAPRRAIMDVRRGNELARRVRVDDWRPPASELTAAASRAAELGQSSVARELYDAAVQASDGAPAILRARRRLPGYAAPVPAELVERAADAAFGASWRPSTTMGESPVPQGWGVGGGVETVVRHHFTSGHTLIRKTFRGLEPREVMAYRSGLLDMGGRWWRAPQMHLAAEDGSGRWHLFIEDLGRLRPPRTKRTLAVAARAIGEMNGRALDDPELLGRVPWLTQAPIAARFVRPRIAASRLAGVVDDDVAARVVRTLATLVRHEVQLSRVHAQIPIVLCHGDPSTTNVHTTRDRVVLLDWEVCGPGTVGTDLAALLRLPDWPVGEDVVQRCLAEYQLGIAATPLADLVTPEQIELGYRHRFVRHSMRRQLAQLLSQAELSRLPSRLERTAGRLPAGRRRARVESNLMRLCDEADRLLGLAGIQGVASRTRRAPR